MTHLSEKTIRYLEEHIPDLAEVAIKQAYWKALASGNSVLKCRNGFLVKVYPDGTEEIIREIEPPVKIKIGTRLEI